MNNLNTLSFQNFIINFILEIIFVVLSFVFFNKIFKTKITKRNHIIYYIINTLCFTTGFLLGNYIFSYLFVLISFVIFTIFIAKISSLKIFAFSGLLSILLLNIQFCIFKIFNKISFCNSYFDMIQSPICNTISIGIILSIIYVFYLFIKKFEIDNLFICSINEKSKLIIATSILNLFISTTISYFFFEIFSNNILYIIILDIYFYFSIDLIVHLCFFDFTKKRINNLKLYNNTISNMYDDTRAFKHDFHNIVQAIGGYILINDMEGLKKYYKQISKDCISSNNLDKLSPGLINNPAIYSILAQKYEIASNNDIQMNFDVMLDLNKLNISIYEFTRILGILLDNAIEASKECNEKNINICFRKDKEKQMLIIENTYNNKQVCIDKIFEKDYTTKPHNTGLGLWEVKRILNKHNHLNLYTTKNNDLFSQQLEIYSS